MKDICVKDLLEITGGSLTGMINDDKLETVLKTAVTDIAIDSREVNEGSVFAAIKGENVDANKFVPAIADKVAAVLTEESAEGILSISGAELLPENRAYIKVDSVVGAMQKIGAYIRDRYDADKHVIGVTGSVGKTTTREMISWALAANEKVFHTEGNMNSQIGVPIMVSRMNDEDSDVAVLEMGISEPGGMDKLTAVVKPDIAVVTIIGDAHIEFMHTREGIRHEKLRIAARMDESGVIFLNADDKLLWDVKGTLDVKTFYYGTNKDADYRAENIHYEDGFNVYTYVHGDDRMTIRLKTPGNHNVLNSLAAMAVCDYLGLDLEKSAKSFESFTGLRQKVIETEKGYTIIDDTYNASPDSMKAALNVLATYPASGRRIAVLGDMFELGDGADDFHREVGEYIKEKCLGNTDKSTDSYIDELITIGDKSRLISDAVKDVIPFKHFSEKSEATAYIKSILNKDDVIILKASNGMKFKDIVSEIQ